MMVNPQCECPPDKSQWAINVKGERVNVLVTQYNPECPKHGQTGIS